LQTNYSLPESLNFYFKKKDYQALAYSKNLLQIFTSIEQFGMWHHQSHYNYCFSKPRKYTFNNKGGTVATKKNNNLLLKTILYSNTCSEYPKLFYNLKYSRQFFFQNSKSNWLESRHELETLQMAYWHLGLLVHVDYYTDNRWYSLGEPPKKEEYNIQDLGHVKGLRDYTDFDAYNMTGYKDYPYRSRRFLKKDTKF